MTNGSVLLKLIASSAIALLILFWFWPRDEQDQQSIDLSPLALEVFDKCINAALTGEPLSVAELGADVTSIFEADSEPASSKLGVELGENFACLVRVRHQHFDPKALRERLEALKISRWDEGRNWCYWRASHQGNSLVTFLTCSIVREGEPTNSFPTNSFTVNLGFIAGGDAMFWM